MRIVPFLNNYGWLLLPIISVAFLCWMLWLAFFSTPPRSVWVSPLHDAKVLHICRDGTAVLHATDDTVWVVRRGAVVGWQVEGDPEKVCTR